MGEISSDGLQTDIGKKIETLRLQHKYSLRELALIADIEHHQLLNIEKGRVDMRLSTLGKIAAALKVEVKNLV